MTLDYVSKYVFGIGLGFSIVLIATAFVISDIRKWVWSLIYWRRAVSRLRAEMRAEAAAEEAEADKQRPTLWKDWFALLKPTAASAGEVTLGEEKKDV